MDTSPHVIDYTQVAAKIALSVGVGLLVGLEREWAQKEVGVRTFAITALLGTLAYLLAPAYVAPVLIGVFLLVALLNVHTLVKDGSLELTTSVALIVMFLLGALVGQGQYFMAAAGAILVTMLLAWKEELSRFAGALLPEEIRGAVLLGLLSVVVYPLLPAGFVDRYHLLNLQEIWIMVMAIAGIGFMNYVLLRLFSTRGLYYAAILGGLVNSTAAAAELATSFRDQSIPSSRALAVLLLTNIAMFLRNVVILGIFAPDAIRYALLPLGIMSLAAVLFAWSSRDHNHLPSGEMKLGSPVSLKRVIKFAALFIALAVVGTLAQRWFHESGFLVFSVVGGVVSSASTVATAATLVTGGSPAAAGATSITPQLAGIATVVASMASALATLPWVYHQTKNRVLTRRLAVVTAITMILGVGGIFADMGIEKFMPVPQTKPAVIEKTDAVKQNQQHSLSPRPASLAVVQYRQS